MKFQALVLSASLSLASSVFADDIQLGNPSYAGSGCPAGSASASLTPDAKTLSILFDSYVVETGGTTGRTSSRKTCNLRVPVHVPQGFQVSLIKVDYRGYNLLPPGASSEFNVEYFFAGSRGPKLRKSFRGELDTDYMLTNDLVVSSLVWSPCGADVNLAINTSMKQSTNSWGDEAMSTVDSTDISAGIIYQLQWRSCR